MRNESSGRPPRSDAFNSVAFQRADSTGRGGIRAVFSMEARIWNYARTAQ